MNAAASPRTLVLGLGVTGLASVEFLQERPGHVVVADTRREPPGLEVLRRQHADVELHLGDFDLALLEDVDQILVSPGLAADIPLLTVARSRGIDVLGDIELFARATTQPVIGITGSNGKSTVTTLVARMLGACGYDIRVGGNLGPPALSLLDDAASGYVLELSSFQLEHTFSLRTQAATVLNISPDHMDRHHGLARYAAIKGSIFDGATVAIVNRDDPMVMQMAPGHPRRVSFGLDEPSGADFGLRLVAGVNWLVRGDDLLVPAAKLRIRGRHNIANGLAALALAESFGADLTRAIEALQTFSGLAHRCQWVGEWHGVTWINDSKGTNVGATVAALHGFKGPLILIAGGAGKGADFAPLAEAARGRVKTALLIGQDASVLADALGGVCEVSLVSDMAEAVAAARKQAEPGETVLLSPACASLDMYADYGARGEDFVSLAQGGVP
jgi:UDP-N-acetylmuramoylalanine--D-glutamate ligase